MLTDRQKNRYLRHILLKEVGAQGQQKLLAARVLVVGAGGLGAPVIQYLAAAGVGRLGIMDEDAVALPNLQRQVIYRDVDVGAPKAARAAEVVRAVNPDTEVDVIDRRFGADEAGLVRDFDLVVEGVDSFEARFAINRACIAARRPLVSAAVGRFSGQVALFKPYAGDLPCYRCFTPEPPGADVLNCGEEGVLGPLVGVVGSMAALEAVKEIVGFGESLAGRMLFYDGLAQTARRVRLPRDPACPDCGGLTRRN